MEEALVNAIIHRDYTELGSEVHVDIYDNRMEIYSPGGMFEGRPVQDLDIMTIPSRRRNPILADIFNRLEYMERRGSGFKKILQSYAVFADNGDTPKPEFRSTHASFFITLWNLNFSAANVVERVVEDDTVNGPVNVIDKTLQSIENKVDNIESDIVNITDNVTDITVNNTINVVDNVVDNVVEKFTYRHLEILAIISDNSHTGANEIAKTLRVASRTIQRDLRYLQDKNVIKRIGPNHGGHWEILRKI